MPQSSMAMAPAMKSFYMARSSAPRANPQDEEARRRAMLAAARSKMGGTKTMSMPGRAESTPRRKMLLSTLGGAYRGQ